MCDYPFLQDKVFVVADDEVMLRELIVEELKDFGVTCLEADNGVEAFELIQNNKVDFIISDIRMPEGSGIDLLKNLQRAGFSEKIPIIVMSGYTDLSLEQAQGLGAITIVGKPFVFSEIFPIINEVLSRKNKVTP